MIGIDDAIQTLKGYAASLREEAMTEADPEGPDAPHILGTMRIVEAIERVLNDREADEFWSKLVFPHGMTAENVRAELADFHFIIEQLPKIYYHVTGGVLSKHMYSAETVISVAEGRTEAVIEVAVADADEELRTEGERLLQRLQDVIPVWSDDIQAVIDELRELAGRPEPAEATS